MHGKKNAYRALVKKPEGKKALGRQRCRCESNNKMDLTERGSSGMDWIN
jgi:hypothetical protein